MRIALKRRPKESAGKTNNNKPDPAPPKASRRKNLVVAAGIAAAVVIAVAYLLSQQSGPLTAPEAKPNPKLGLVIMPPSERSTFGEVHNAYISAASTGIGRSNVYMLWPTIEPQEGNFNWRPYDILMGLNREQHLNVTLYFSIINNEEFGPFPSWIGQNPSLDEKLANETATALNAILSRYYIVDYVMVGGDLNVYFRTHPGEIPKYVSFFNSVYEKVKASHPDVKMGNWFSLNDLINHSEGDMVKKLDQGDFVAYSFSPVDLVFYQPHGPGEEAAQLQKMFDFSGGKNVALMEIGWATDKSVNGTEANQVKFMKDTFDFFRENEPRIDFMTWYRQYDRPFSTCYDSLNMNVPTGFGNKILLNNTAAYLCSTGLVGDNNQTKPSWDEFKSEIRSTPIS